MEWAELNYSKKQVRKAGGFLSRKYSTPSDLDEYINKYLFNYNIFSNWRAAHAYPMQSMLMYFRKHALNVDESSIIAQRLKRAPSIISKLSREQGMNLDRMEDIAGCRIIVKTISDVYKTRDMIINGRTRNILHRERDYIANPKASGYRGIHLVYKYNGKKTNYSGLAVELQIRSKVQHSWATAVEVVGAFTGQALKASQGASEWLEFFQLASIAFSKIENKKLTIDYSDSEHQKLILLSKKLDVLSKIRAFAVSTNKLSNNKRKGDDYFLLKLDTEKSIISLKSYASSELDQATSHYSEIEREVKDKKHIDVVLVSTKSIHSLKKAYPNYFADTSEFSKFLSKATDGGNI
ncbi:hypothetical protein [Aeromonas media]|uniref:hypothetical protein n=1 Tax=Aeromonas media TaxID=651 RepID=UPI003D257627